MQGHSGAPLRRSAAAKSPRCEGGHETGGCSRGLYFRGVRKQGPENKHPHAGPGQWDTEAVSTGELAKETTGKSTPHRGMGIGPRVLQCQDSKGLFIMLICLQAAKGKLLVHSFHPGQRGPARRSKALSANGAHPAMAVGTTDTHPLTRGEEGAIFFRIKSKNFPAFRYASPRS